MRIVLFILFFIPFNVVASNVQWGLGEHYEYSHTGEDDAYGFCMIFPVGVYEHFVDMLVYSTMTTDGKGLILDFEKEPGYSGVREKIAVAKNGDVITIDGMRGLGYDDCLIHHRLDDDVYNAGSATVAVNPYTVNYLAVLTAGNQSPQGDDYVVGWMSYMVDSDGKFQVINSAHDLDGGPMIVGGGAYSIPEPSGGLLSLLGGALLTLRRRHRLVV